VCAAYVTAVYAAAMTITDTAGGRWLTDPVGPGLALVAGVVMIAALSLGGLASLTEDVGDTTGIIVQLGPFGAQEGGAGLWVWSAAFLALVAGAAVWDLRAATCER
jgi:hypothetical protein